MSRARNARRDKADVRIPPDIQALLDATPNTEGAAELIQADLARLECEPDFVAGYLKAQFVESVLEVMECRGLNKNSLAAKLGKSRQYVGRILNETANFTLETMAEISCALEKRLDVCMYGPSERVAILPALTRPHAVLPFDDSAHFVPQVDCSTYAQGGQDAGHFAA